MEPLDVVAVVDILPIDTDEGIPVVLHVGELALSRIGLAGLGREATRHGATVKQRRTLLVSQSVPALLTLNRHLTSVPRALELLGCTIVLHRYS